MFGSPSMARSRSLCGGSANRCRSFGRIRIGNKQRFQLGAGKPRGTPFLLGGLGRALIFDRITNVYSSTHKEFGSFSFKPLYKGFPCTKTHPYCWICWGVGIEVWEVGLIAAATSPESIKANTPIQGSRLPRLHLGLNGNVRSSAEELGEA